MTIASDLMKLKQGDAMTADIETLYGLHGANLARYREAQAIIATNMRALDPERLLRDMRAELELARQAFPVSRARADGHEAVAANLLAVAIRIQS